MEWFNKIKGKLQFFSIGLMAGLIVGGSFFIFKLDDYFKELRSFKHSVREQENTTKENEFEGRENEKMLKSKKEKVISKKNIEPYKKPESSDSLKEMPNEELINKNIALEDSSVSFLVEVQDTGSKSLSENQENVIVRKDELVASKIIEVQNLNSISKNNDNKMDSIIQKTSGIRDEVTKTSYKLEIWKSPLNYKGYKMTKSKIILYGVPNYETIKLYQLEDDYYIKTNLNTYKIDYSSEFKQLERVFDESILAKLR